MQRDNGRTCEATGARSAKSLWLKDMARFESGWKDVSKRERGTG